VLPPPRLERIPLPTAPPAPARTAFPLAASLAPVIVAGGIWAVTGSPYSLLFAVLGPVVALGSLFDARRQRRRTARRERERVLAALGRVRGQVEAARDRERTRLDRIAPEGDRVVEPRRVVEGWSREPSASSDPEGVALPVRIGRAELDGVVELSGEFDADAPAALCAAVGELRLRAERLEKSPWLLDAREGIGLVGPSLAAAAVARSLAVQLLARCSPANSVLVAPVDQAWVTGLPHRVTPSSNQAYRVLSGGREVVIAWARESAELPAGLGNVIRLSASGAASGAASGVEAGVGHPASGPRDAVHGALGEAGAREAARALAEVARLHGIVDPATALPERVSLAEVLAADAPTADVPTAEVPTADRASSSVPGLRAPIGVGPEGVIELDLVSEGPHAVVAGTTGTGKSELLVSWVLAMAARHPPSEVSFLLVDFKGGAAFAPLAEVPHVVGIVSDLDARRSRRAIESLRAELRRRELLLAERGARSIDELPGELARLVIVVDEFAAVVSGRPELHEVFADLAARGRSLGLHLVLCTQRPAGVIRDGVLANIALRISLRVTDRGDSAAMLGSDAAFALGPTQRGRAVIADGSGVVREVQLALAEPGDAARVRGHGATAGAASPTVWCDPLPEVLLLDELRRDPEWHRAPGIPFGRLDLPAEQRQPLAVHDPGTGGHVLVLGAARAGRTTALATFGDDLRCRVLPRDPAEAWTVLDGLSRDTGAAAERIVLLIDDLDVLIDAVDPDARHEFVDRLARIARESRRVTLIASAQRITGPLQRMIGLFEARLLLRQSSRDEHVLAGGDGAAFDPGLPAGAGTWRGGGSASTLGQTVTVQVAIGGRPLPAAELPELPRVRLEPGAVIALVAGRPREVLRAWEAGAGGIRGVRIIRLGEDVVPDDGELRVTRGEPIVLLGDPDAWQTEWALLSTVRREYPLVFTGCTAAELRSLARIRETPPPLGERPGECWLIDGGDVRRAILEL
jgi:S-DNA-T family DNA segregation ATPase FtsK/SpoIIIE